jgi:pSer/pThr/pTyr-binding forkhead associated (FHA) protein
VFCTHCGHRNPDDARFCANCGAVLQDDTTVSFTPIDPSEEPGDSVLAAQHDLRPDQALLVVERGPNAGSRYLIDADRTTLGRQPESDIFLDDVTVSRRHAEISRGGGRFSIHDKGSLNGTYVNLHRVEDTELADQDEIQIGKFKLVVYMAHEARD